MPVLTYTRFQAITGDTATLEAAFDAAVAVTEADLAETLGRPLESAERTERCRIYVEARGLVVYPQATPVTAASGYTIAGSGLIGASPVGSPAFLSEDPDFASVTYTGGWSTSTVPRAVEKAVAWGVYDDLNPDTSVPDGATSVRVGDAAVSYARSTVTGERTWPRSVLRYRHRTVALGYR